MSRSRINVRESGAALEKMKFEVASELGVGLKQGYNGNLSSRDNGYVGGYMVKKMFTGKTTRDAGNMFQSMGEMNIHRDGKFGHPVEYIYTYAISVD
jgi:hypothetical protein